MPSGSDLQCYKIDHAVILHSVDRAGQEVANDQFQSADLALVGIDSPMLLEELIACLY